LFLFFSRNHLQILLVRQVFVLRMKIFMAEVLEWVLQQQLRQRQPQQLQLLQHRRGRVVLVVLVVEAWLLQQQKAFYKVYLSFGSLGK
jgi:hypothetical protein